MKRDKPKPHSPPPHMPGTDEDYRDYYDRPSKAASTPVHTPTSSEIAGIPKVVLAIILGNFALWICGFISFWAGKAGLLDILGGLIFFVAALFIWLAIQYIGWKMYWWLVALSVCVMTIGLAYLYIMVMTGRLVLEQIRFPQISF